MAWSPCPPLKQAKALFTGMPAFSTARLTNSVRLPSGPELGLLTLNSGLGSSEPRIVLSDHSARELSPIKRPHRLRIGALQRNHPAAPTSDQPRSCPYELLGPSGRTFCNNKPRYRHNREPVVDSARFHSADDDRTVAAQFIDGIIVPVHVLSPRGSSLPTGCCYSPWSVDGAVVTAPSTSIRKPPMWMQRRANFADKE
jgi:hypothetical protein